MIQIRFILDQFKKSTLIVNAWFLMLSTFIVSATGFVFWLIVAKTHEPGSVGLATSLLSVSNLVALLGLFGFDSSLVRFMPNARNKSSYIVSSLLCVALATTVLGFLVALALPHFSASFSFVGGWFALTEFMVFTTFTALNVLTNAVFLAHKHALYILIINCLFSSCKVFLPFLFPHCSVMVVFAIAGFAQCIGFTLSLVWICHKYEFSFRLQIDTELLKLIKKFSLTTYASSILNLLPVALLPLLIIHELSSKDAAFYYMAFTIASSLYTIAYASMQSVFAEGSHNRQALKFHVIKAARLVAILLLPSSLLVGVLSSTLLRIFGHQYASSAGQLLQLFMWGAPVVAVYSALGAIFKVTKNLRAITIMNSIYCTSILGLSLLGMHHFGLAGVGWAWIAGNAFADIAGLYFLKTPKAKRLVVVRPGWMLRQNDAAAEYSD